MQQILNGNGFAQIVRSIQHAQSPDTSSKIKSCPACNGTGYVVKNDENGRPVCAQCTICNMIEENRLLRLNQNSNLPETISVPPVPEALKFMRDYSPTLKKWLLFAGKTGSGKTTQAVSVARQLINKRYAKVSFYNAYDLTRKLTASKRRVDDHEHLVDEIATVDLLVLDDFLKVVPRPDAFGYTEFLESTYEIIWARYDSGKPMILTTQATRNSMVQIDAALAGRIVERSRGYVVYYSDNAPNRRLM